MFRRQTGHTRTLRQSTAQKQTHTLTAETPCHWLSRGVQRNVTSRSYSVRSLATFDPLRSVARAAKVVQWNGTREWPSWLVNGAASYFPARSMPRWSQEVEPGRRRCEAGGRGSYSKVVRSLPRKSYHHDHSTEISKPKPVFFGLLDQRIHALWSCFGNLSILVCTSVYYIEKEREIRPRWNFSHWRWWTGLCSRHVQLAQDSSCYAFSVSDNEQ